MQVSSTSSGTSSGGPSSVPLIQPPMDEERRAVFRELLLQYEVDSPSVSKKVWEERWEESWFLGMPRPGMAHESETTRLSGANGASVAVTSVEGRSAADTLHLGVEEGWQVEVPFSGGLRIARTEHGAYAVYFTGSDVTRTYAADGTYSEAAGDLTDPDAGRIFVSNGYETLQGGAGNDTFLVYGVCRSVHTGEGDNTVIIKGGLSGAYRTDEAMLVTGNGNNAITVEGTLNGAVELGDGNNIVSVEGMGLGSTLRTGSGDNSISVSRMAHARLTLGDGDNFVSVDSMHNASIDTGNGNSIFSVQEMTGQSYISMIHTVAPASDSAKRTLHIGSMSDNSSVYLVRGDNTVHVGSMTEKALVSQWFGSMAFSADHLGGSASVFCLTDRTSVSVNNMSGQAKLRVHGDSSVNVGAMSESASMFISSLAGGFKWNVDSKGYVTPGTGPCTAEVVVGLMRDRASAALIGAGHLAAVGELRDRAALNLSQGRSTVVVGEAGEDTSLNVKEENLSVIEGLDQGQRDAVEALLARWQDARNEAELPATGKDLWASLTGKAALSEALSQRLALLLTRN